MENTPAAAAPATEANPNTNPNPDSQTQGGGQSTPPKPDPFDNFVNANGGRDKVYEKMKQAIGDPEGYARSVLGLDANNQPLNAPAPVQPQAPVDQPPVQPQQPVAPSKPAEGYISPNDIMALQYNRLMKEAYPELEASYMDKGEYLKEATSMGITVVDAQGNFNDVAIRKFLDMKKSAIPPTPASAPITSTPTVEYQTVEGEITAVEQAHNIMQQGEGHPQYSQAVQFLRESIFGKPKEKK